jgi:osmotically-inducible protein OsmY
MRAHRRLVQTSRCWRQAFLGMGLVLALWSCATVDPQDDMRIEADVKARLVGDKGANLTEVGVSCAHAVVYLTGAVESTSQKVQAEALARHVKNVRRVVNLLEVRSTPK